MLFLQVNQSPRRFDLHALCASLPGAKSWISRKYSIFQRLSAIKQFGVLSMPSMEPSRLNFLSMTLVSSKFLKPNFVPSPRSNGAKAWSVLSTECTSKAKTLERRLQTQNGTSLLGRTKALFFVLPFVMRSVDSLSSTLARFQKTHTQ